MIVLDWITLALLGGFVAAAAAASLLDRRRAKTKTGTACIRSAEAGGLWGVAEAVWTGARPARAPHPAAAIRDLPDPRAARRPRGIRARCGSRRMIVARDV